MCPLGPVLPTRYIAGAAALRQPRPAAAPKAAFGNAVRVRRRFSAATRRRTWFAERVWPAARLGSAVVGALVAVAPAPGFLSRWAETNGLPRPPAR